MPGNNNAGEGKHDTMRKGGRLWSGWESQDFIVRLDSRPYSVVFPTTLRICCRQPQKSARRFHRSRFTQKMNIFPNELFSNEIKVLLQFSTEVRIFWGAFTQHFGHFVTVLHLALRGVGSGRLCRSVADSLFRPNPEQRARASREPKSAINFHRFSPIFVETGQFWNKECASISTIFTNFRRNWPVLK